MKLPLVRFASGESELDPIAREAALTTAWAAMRWKVRTLAVPGLSQDAPERPTLAQRRALAIAGVLQNSGITLVPAPRAGQSFCLRAVTANDIP